MSTAYPQSQARRRQAIVTLLVAISLSVLACGGPNDLVIAGTAAAAFGTSTGPELAVTPAPGGAVSTAQCQVIGDAFLHFKLDYPRLELPNDEAYEAYAANTPYSPQYLDLPQLRSDLDVLATLPGGTTGDLGSALAGMRQLVDLVDDNMLAGGTPFSDGTDMGQRAMDLYFELTGPYLVIAESFATNCPNYAAATPAAVAP